MKTELSADDSRYTVPALARGLEILSYFNKEQRVLSGAQISKLSNLPRASVFRMLQTLEQAGYLEKHGEQGAHPSYRLGLAVLRLGYEYLSSQELTEIGRPLLESLSDLCGHSSHIVVRDGREVVFVSKALGKLATFHAIQVGARLPAHATVLGRVLMAGMSLKELEKLYADQPMKAFMPTTPQSPEALKKLIDEASKAGFAVSQGGFEAGISTVAAPAFNAKGKVCAAVSVTVLSARIAPEKLPVLISQVREAADELTKRLKQSEGAWA